MDSQLISRENPKIRHRCDACYKNFGKPEHLVDHVNTSYHSVHQPRCGSCQKHCKSLESVREHLNANLSKGNCRTTFSQRGCGLCLQVFDDATALGEHEDKCRLSPPPRGTASQENVINPSRPRVGKAVAIDCEMVAGDGHDGPIHQCASVCLVDEDENVILSTYVQPQHPVTDYRHEITGLTEEKLKDGMPLVDVREKILAILCDGHHDEAGRLLLVGHDLRHDMSCLKLQYPSSLLRDTAKYVPLMKTSLVSQSLKYLTKSYLGYEIQCNKHDPYEDCVSAMRLYKRMRDQVHRKAEGKGLKELYSNSKSDYHCWCLDRINP